MNELEIRQLAFRRLKPRYKWIVRALAFFLAVSPLIVLCAVNLGLATVLGVEPNRAVKEQPAGQLWFVLFMVQIVVILPFAVFAGRRCLARLAGERLGWSEQEIRDIGAGRTYPDQWMN